MHPVLGTMMPKICEAPHLPTSRFQPSFSSELNEWGRSSHSQHLQTERRGAGRLAA